MIESNSPIFEVRIFDATGRIKYKGTESTIQVSDWCPGIYFINMETFDGVFNHKFLKK